jgi:hypothetical protein
MADLVENVNFIPFEPKLSNRYVFSIAGAAAGLDAYLIKAAARPKLDFEEVQLDQMNLVRYVKGKGTWGEIAITLYDPIVPSAAQAVMEWVKLSHEATTGREGYAVNYKKECKIQVLGPVGDIVEEWILTGCWIKATDFGELKFDGAEPVEISLTLRYDYATLTF